MTAEPNRPLIAILLCTHNGEAFLKEQLDSYAAQTWDNWVVVVSDDKSTDQTRVILGEYQHLWGAERFKVVDGPARGYVENFLTITRSANGQADYYAWSDQDDIWCPDKLERALDWLQTIPAEIPALYCGRTRLVSSDNREIGMSKLCNKKPSFGNALMQSIAGGNTMVFNQAACQLIAETSEGIAVASHDWWAYIVITGCGGRLYYDPVPTLRYRQHDDNLIGANTNWSARIERILQLFKGRYRHWNNLHLEALHKYRSKLTGQSSETLLLFANARQRSLPMRLVQLKRSDVYRQTSMDNVGLVLAAIFRKI